MKLTRTLFMIAFGVIAFVSEGKSQVNSSSTYVPGYVRSDGSYVNGYYKTTPNNTNRDNYTTKPNTNPYTGSKGYIQPDNKPLNSVSTIQYSTPEYTAPKYNPSYSAPISTGSRGGQYYINSNGNKTYVKRY